MADPVKGAPCAEVDKSAVISECGRYRYELRRTWGDEPPMTFIMLNPSTADAAVDDRTIRRCMNLAYREGRGGIIVVNLFALRTPHPADLWKHDEPEGRENWRYVGEAITAADDFAVAAWGAIPRAGASRSFTYGQIWTHRYERWLRCIGTTADGSPRHPLYVRGDAPLMAWPVVQS